MLDAINQGNWSYLQTNQEEEKKEEKEKEEDGEVDEFDLEAAADDLLNFAAGASGVKELEKSSGLEKQEDQRQKKEEPQRKEEQHAASFADMASWKGKQQQEQSTNVKKRSLSTTLSKKQELKQTNVQEEEDFPLYTPHPVLPVPSSPVTCPSCQTIVPPKKFLRTNVRFCHFTGQWYCRACHKGRTSLVPAHVVSNWNFKKFPVNELAFEEIMGGLDSPVIDMATANAKLYHNLPEFKKIRLLRGKMTIMAEFIFLCEQSERLVGMAGGRAHFFGTGDYYSLNDLVGLKGGGLVAELEDLLRKYRDHVSKCEGCQSRGNSCGECDNEELLFPFGDVGGGKRRCAGCGHVFHHKCYEMLEATRAECKNCGQMVTKKKVDKR